MGPRGAASPTVEQSESKQARKSKKASCHVCPLRLKNSLMRTRVSDRAVNGLRLSKYAATSYTFAKNAWSSSLKALAVGTRGCLMTHWRTRNTILVMAMIMISRTGLIKPARRNTEVDSILSRRDLVFISENENDHKPTTCTPLECASLKHYSSWCKVDEGTTSDPQAQDTVPSPHRPHQSSRSAHDSSVCKQHQSQDASSPQCPSKPRIDSLSFAR